MKTSAFSQSLFAVSLLEAIRITAEIGFDGRELACKEPQLTAALARDQGAELLGYIQERGLSVSALSLFSQFTDPQTLDREIEQALAFIECAPTFETQTVKITPGPPASERAQDLHWECLRRAVDVLTERAGVLGVRLAVETHLNHLSDRVAPAQRILNLDPAGVLGVNLDFCNLAFGGDDPVGAIESFRDRLYLPHLKNGYIRAGTYDFRTLEEGMGNYPDILAELQAVRFDGDLSIECLGTSAWEHPRDALKYDFEILRAMLGG